MGEAQPAAGQAPEAAEVTVGRFALAFPVMAAVLAVLALASAIADVPLEHVIHQLTFSNVGQSVLLLAFVLVGVVVAWRLPSHPMGWLLLGVGLFFVLSGVASDYAFIDYRVHHGTLPLGAVAVLLGPGWAPAIALLGLTILLFPDGRLPSRRWRWVLWAYLLFCAMFVAGTLAIAARVIIEHQIHIDPGGGLTVLDNVTTYAWFGIAQGLFFIVLLVSWLSWLVLQVIRFRRSTGERHEQMKWLLGGAACCVVSLPTLLLTGNASSLLTEVLNGIALLGLAALPVSIGVAILKYRLYDIDRIISRTLAYAIVTGLLVGLYAGLVLLATRVLPFSSPVAVAASTLAAAALFSPLRRRVQRVVDRRFNRARYNADQTVAAFAARLQDAMDLDAVRADLSGVVQKALEPAHVSMWIRGGGQ